MLDRVRELYAGARDRVDVLFDFARDVMVLVEERLRLLTTLTETVLTVGVVRAHLRDDVVLQGRFRGRQTVSVQWVGLLR